MKKIAAVIVSVFLLLSFIMIQPAKAKVQQPTRERVFEILHAGFQAQVKLGEKHVTKQQAVSILSPYFDSSYIQRFLDENLVKEAQGYITYGSDYALYYIPYFSYDDLTNVMYDPKHQKIYVYEHFPAVTDGPVTYGDHYELMVLRKQHSSWKIEQYVYSEEVPKEVTSSKNLQSL
ncbi:DUF3993 domain-containing protein [Bacillus songklensis]|uniref:DUF3993 domain-containing protein n=1 Tax=Bacillus songklensis TaxID=1069116 RepID=A0ABV8B4S4_9BACI